MYEPHSIQIQTDKIPRYIGFEVELAGISVAELQDCIPSDSNFTAVRDDSIKIIEDHICPNCKRPHKVIRERHGAELVSPKTKIADVPRVLDSFAGIVSEAVSYGAHVNITTACHVHVDRRDFGPDELHRTLELFCSVEDAAFKEFTGDLDEPRILYVDLYNFARSMRRFVDMNLKHQGTNAFLNMADKYWAWNVSTHGHRGEPRKTIEYRLFNSTTNHEKLRSMIAFALGCSYLGVITAEAGPPSCFASDRAVDQERAAAVQNIVALGKSLLEISHGEEQKAS